MVEKKTGKLAVRIKEELAFTAEDVRKYYCPQATEKEIALFLEISKQFGLNPFKREIYLIKYGSEPAKIVTGYETYLKRAERSLKYGGFKVWTKGSVIDADLTACIEVFRKDWDKPLCHEVDYKEYVARKRDGTPTRFWADKPKTMLKKVVISQAFRFAFPDELAGIPYATEEINELETGWEQSGRTIDVTADKPPVPTMKPAPPAKAALPPQPRTATPPPPRVAPPLKASTAPPPKPKAATPPPIPAPKPATGQITQDQLNQLIDYQAQFPLIRFQAAFDAFHIKKLEELNSVQANELLAQLKVYAEKRKSPAPAKPPKQEGK